MGEDDAPRKEGIPARSLLWMAAAAIAVFLVYDRLRVRQAPPTPGPAAGPGYACAYSHPRGGKFDANAVAGELVVPGPVPGEPPAQWRLLVQIRDAARFADAGFMTYPEGGVLEPSLFHSTHDGVRFVEIVEGRPVSGNAGPPGTVHRFQVDLDVRGAVTFRIGKRAPVRVPAGFDSGIAMIGLQLSPGQTARGQIRNARFKRKGSAVWRPFSLETTYLDPDLSIRPDGATAEATRALRFVGLYRPPAPAARR